MAFEYKKLSVDNGRDEYDMLQLIGSDENGFTNEVYGMTYNEYRKWLVEQNDYSFARNLPQNYIPQSTFFLYADGVAVGIARIRHFAADFLEQQGVGRFGYGIAKPYRGKGYGSVLYTHTVRQMKLMGIRMVKSFVDIDNIPSNRIFRRNGAVLSDTFKETKNVYIIRLD